MRYSLRKYPEFDLEFQRFLNEMMKSFVEEGSQLLKEIHKEPISEGDEHVLQRMDGTTSKMVFEEISTKGTLPNGFIIDCDIDYVIGVVYGMAKTMTQNLEGKLLKTVFDAAQEYGNVFTRELSVDTVFQLFEHQELTFDDNGMMNQRFVIPPQLTAKLQEIMSDPKIIALIDKKRREYFAKKNH